MSVRSVCHKWLEKTLITCNLARIKTLALCVDGLIKGQQLTLTAIGRNISTKTYVKHNIKRVDRFLSNPHLNNETPKIYQLLCQQILKNISHCIVAVDWSGCASADYFVIRASLVFQGRSIPLLNYVVEARDQETESSHQVFMQQLKFIIGARKQVTVITDAGFKTPWFEMVEQAGWFYVGRARGRIYAKLNQCQWLPVRELFKGASKRAKFLGDGLLGKTSKSQCLCYFHLYKEPSKGRHKKRGRYQPLYPDAELMYSLSAKEPWLLVTNNHSLKSREVVNLYSKRMQIEQNFRDDKSQRYGFSWRNSQTRGVQRLSVLCLIACIATMLLWLIGFETERMNEYRKFQANTIKRRVLSFLTLGHQITMHAKQFLKIRFINQALKSFSLEYSQMYIRE